MPFFQEFIIHCPKRDFRECQFLSPRAKFMRKQTGALTSSESDVCVFWCDGEGERRAQGCDAKSARAWGGGSGVAAEGVNS